MLRAALVTPYLSVLSHLPHLKARFRSHAYLDCPDGATQRSAAQICVRQGTEAQSICSKLLNTTSRTQIGHQHIVVNIIPIY